MCCPRTYIYTIGPELLQTRVHGLENLLGRVPAQLGGVLDLGGKGQASLRPLGLARESLLLPTDINTGRVDLVVPARLEGIQDLVVLPDVGDAGSIRLVGSKGHETEDDTVLGRLGD